LIATLDESDIYTTTQASSILPFIRKRSVLTSQNASICFCWRRDWRHVHID